MPPSSYLRYLVENVEEDIEEWCSLEYEHICQAVGANKVIFTNVLDSDLASIRKRYNPKVFSASIGSLREEFDLGTAVLLDMDAEEELRPGDAKDFRLCVFGGILGNVPSDDRTSEVRKHGFPHARNLGPEQMTTNTAVLVTKIILEDQVPLSKIPFVDDPEIPVGDTGRETISLPFRYVAKSYFTHQSSDSDTPVLPDRMIQYLRKSGDLSLC
ncbi:sam-dependent rna methyltransferase [Cystoisospora suis]|uniref:Sam-dependent rna methyltransferase n=1 Tax=Cystoisospora suis TaxID=483139 RepID=A0A2C6KGJ9_9APIC|nr:sam-dependent rna methyltransferase [Cystoisospora suis]